VINAVGVNGDGRREVLGLTIGASEAEIFWTDFLRARDGRSSSSQVNAGVFTPVIFNSLVTRHYISPESYRKFPEPVRTSLVSWRPMESRHSLNYLVRNAL
jgi:hypothetical protein